MSYNPDILPLAGGALIMGILCIVLRARVSKSASAVYKGTLLERLVLSQEKSEKWMIIVGVVVIALSIGIVISGFFIS